MTVDEKPGESLIRAGSLVLMSVTDADADAAGIDRSALASANAEAIRGIAHVARDGVTLPGVVRSVSQRC